MRHEATGECLGALIPDFITWGEARGFISNEDIPLELRRSTTSGFIITGDMRTTMIEKREIHGGEI
jgi:hypothetical protein